ncbi:hypothetical protein MATL_G00073860 [Megalops atlanticus]|uniref:SEFIR domain-containing protein n=1 Tax=Megalops atlanticus TaxID=7932 RepID=A0A9D3TGF8_MEGAT|nr:hypothetical protein MATL_G00073860 [Megalops atlanticus]
MTIQWWQLAAGLVSLSQFVSAVALDKIEWDQNRVICAQGLINCRVRDEVLRGPDFGSVDVSRLELQAFLCCKDQACKPCVKIQAHFTITGLHDNRDMSGDGDDDEEKEAEEEDVSVSLCYSIPGSIPSCKRIEFKVPTSALVNQNNTEIWVSLLVSETVYFGSLLLVSVKSLNQTITVPLEKEVCSPELRGYMEECDIPRLRTVIDWKRGVASLKLDAHNMDSKPRLCLKFGENGSCMPQQLNQTEFTFSLNSVTSCLCFEVRKTGALLGSMGCPFENYSEFQRNTWDRVQVSMVPAQTNSEEVALAWNLTAPCRLKAELWLCRMGAWGGAGEYCREVEGSRQRLEDESRTWQENSQGYWIQGDYADIVPHPSLCVLVKVRGKDSTLGPWCPFSTPRRRWALPALISMILICVAVLGACLLHNSLKSWVRGWFKDDSIKGAMKGGQVLLLCPPDVDPTLSNLVNRLGSSLSTLGFKVTLDLWSRSELCALGPVPWLHAQLDQLQREGGRAVLILTRTAWERAAQWSRERDTAKDRTSPYSDVFSASLSCILADYLQGGTGERFILTHFESLPSLTTEKGGVEPEVLCGLRRYSLPSQARGFLQELAAPSCGHHFPQFIGLRASSRALKTGLWGSEALGVCQDSMDAKESAPLQGCHVLHTSRGEAMHCV